MFVFQPLEPVDLIPASLPSDSATPASSFTVEQDDLWLDFLAFTLLGGLAPTPPSAAAGAEEGESAAAVAGSFVGGQDAGRIDGVESQPSTQSAASLQQLKSAIAAGQVDVSRALADIDEERLSDLFLRFMHDNKERIRDMPTNARVQSDDDGVGSVD